MTGPHNIENKSWPSKIAYGVLVGSILKTKSDGRSHMKRQRVGRSHTDVRTILSASIAAVGLTVTGFVVLALWFLYHSTLEGEKVRLTDIVTDSAVRLAARPSTQTGARDIIIAEMGGGFVTYRSPRHAGGARRGVQIRLPIGSKAAEPFRRAQAGEIGALITVDRYGRRAVAAFAPLAGRRTVVAAFTPVSEILKSCTPAAVLIVLSGLVFVLAAALVIRSLSRSLFRHLTEQEAMVRSTVNNINDVFFVVDGNWNVTFANKRAEDLFQREFAELAGKPLWDEVPELSSVVYRPLDKALRTQQFESIEGVYPPANKWFEMRAYPNEGGLAISMIDITRLRQQKQRLQEAEARFRNLVEGSIQGIAIHQDGHIVYTNEACARLIGYETDEIVGMPVANLIWPDDIPLFQSHKQARERGETDSDCYYLRLRQKDCEPIWVEAMVREIEWNGLPASQAAIVDVSEQKAAEEALHRQSELAELLKNIAVSVNEANSVDEALQAALRRICAYMDWPIGHAFLVDMVDGELTRSSSVWSITDPERYWKLRRVSESQPFTPGIGTASRVIRDAGAYCDIDIGQDSADPQDRAALEAGLQLQSAYPILSGDDVVGIMEFFHRRSSRSDKAISKNMSVVGAQLGRVIERDRAKWRLAKSEQRFKDFAEVSSDWYWELGPDLRFTYFSEQFFALVGVPPEAIYGMTPETFFFNSGRGAQNANSIEDVMRHVDDLENHRPFRNFECVAVRPTDRRRLAISISGTPVFDTKGMFVGYRGTATDISKRKQAENRLRTTLRHQEVINAVLSLSLDDVPLERKLERALGSIQSAEWLSIEPKGGVFLFDDNTGQLVLRAQRNLPDPLLTKCAKVELGQCLCGTAALTKQIIHTADVDHQHEITFPGMDDHGHYIVPILSRGKVLGVLVLYLPTGHIKDESEVTFLEAIAATLASMIESEHSKEERENLEGLLLQSQKMEAIGTLAGGVAHDINNTLVPILGLTELMIDDTPEDDGNHENLQIIHDSAERTRKLVDQILSFSRKDVPERTAQDVNDIVAKSLTLLRSTVPTSIQINTSLSEDALVAQIDSTQIQQVILNLTTNAVQSMDGPGVLDVTTDTVVVGVDHVSRCPDLLPGPHAHITVKDTGCGMDDETLGRIFDPFYTTKDVGEGTGLGLSVVHGIVSSHGGGICVSSRPGEGTEFQVFIPLSVDGTENENTAEALAS